MFELIDITYEINEGEASRRILDHISLKVLSGELLAVTGPNGCGKSTLAKIIMSILKPTTGQMIFDGRDNNQSE